jgi:hypothetical protein
VTREAVVVAMWRTRLYATRNRCIHVAEQSLAATQGLAGIRRPCQQKDARIYSQRGRDALLAVTSIDQMTEARTTTCLRGGSTAKGLSAGHGAVTP